MTMTAAVEDRAVTTALPLLTRFPELAQLPRASLGRFPSPVQSLEHIAPGLWVKRDDLNAERVAGNKVRALEFLLGGLRPGERVVTVGARCSTHALATCVYARELGARGVVLQWPQESTPMSDAVAAEITAVASERHMYRSVLAAYARGAFERLRGARWIGAGGSTPLGILGHVNAALEFAAQVKSGVLPMPSRIVLPLGSGGTTAGLLLGLRIAELPVRVTAVRVVPRLVANSRRVLRLANATADLIEIMSGDSVPRPNRRSLTVDHSFYGGAYGRETPAGRAASERFVQAVSGSALDPTYVAKAFAAALIGGEGVLFWKTR